MGIIITILALCFVIFIHELGHMYAALRCGVGVLEFSIGMGPRLWKKVTPTTTYSLRLLPLGGYVKLAGLDDDDGGVSDDVNFKKKPLFSRMFVILAGSVMNLVLGVLLFVVTTLFMGAPVISDGKPVLTSTVRTLGEGMPAAMAGIRVNDRIVAINGQSFSTVPNFIKMVQDSDGQSLSVLVNRDGDQRLISLTSQWDDSLGRRLIGVSFKPLYDRSNMLKSAWYGVEKGVMTIVMVFKSFGMLFSGQATLKQLTGPVGIVQFASSQLGVSAIRFLEVIAMISLSLGVINLFPFPVLDGGHMVFLTLEGLLGRPVSPKVEYWISQAGALVLITMMVFVVFNDIRFWQYRVGLLSALGR